MNLNDIDTVTDNNGDSADAIAGHAYGNPIHAGTVEDFITHVEQAAATGWQPHL